MDETSEGKRLAGAIKQVARLCVKLNFSFADADTLFRRAYTDAVIAGAGGNKCEAARRMGVHRNTVPRLLRIA